MPELQRDRDKFGTLDVPCSSAVDFADLAGTRQVGKASLDQLRQRAAIEARALRYTAFVERAAAYVPLLVTPSPF